MQGLPEQEHGVVDQSCFRLFAKNYCLQIFQFKFAKFFKYRHHPLLILGRKRRVRIRHPILIPGIVHPHTRHIALVISGVVIRIVQGAPAVIIIHRYQRVPLPHNGLYFRSLRVHKSVCCDVDITIAEVFQVQSVQILIKK